MLEGAFSFRGRIGRRDFIFGGLLMLAAGAVGIAVLIALGVMTGALHSMAGLVFVGIVGGLMLIAAVWYSLSLHVRRIRDIGWDPFVVIVGWLAVDAIDAMLAAKVPALAFGQSHGHAHHGTLFGMLFNTGLTVALLVRPSRERPDIAGVFGDGPEPPQSRLAALGVDASSRVETVPAAAPMRTVARKEFGRRGVR